jgi:hypothetical protein
MRGEADRIGDGLVPVWPIIRSLRRMIRVPVAYRTGEEDGRNAMGGPKQAKLRISDGSEPTYARLVRVRHHESLCCRFSTCCCLYAYRLIL